MRDLCRTREDIMVTDLVRARHRLTKFLLRHDQIYRDGSAWTIKHEQWLSTRRFAEPAMPATFELYRAVLAARQAELRALEADLAHYLTAGPFADAVSRLSAYRGITQLGALTLASEVGDWRRFGSAASTSTCTCGAPGTCTRARPQASSPTSSSPPAVACWPTTPRCWCSTGTATTARPGGPWRGPTPGAARGLSAPQ